MAVFTESLLFSWIKARALIDLIPALAKGAVVYQIVSEYCFAVSMLLSVAPVSTAPCEETTVTTTESIKLGRLLVKPSTYCIAHGINVLVDVLLQGG